MPPPQHLLVVDENESGRLLLVWTLRQQFPRAAVTEADHAEAALARVAGGGLDAVIVHRVPGLHCADLVRAVREASATVPIVAVSGFDQTQEEALAAGASTFVHFEHWKRIGRAVASAVSGGTKLPARRGNSETAPCAAAGIVGR